MPLINLDAVLNPLPELKDHILDYIPRATTSEFGIVALGSGINVDTFGRIYLDTQEYSDRLTAIETTAASTLETTVNTLETKADELATSITQKLGMPNGIATLDSAGNIPASQLPSYVDDVLEYESVAAFPATGVTDKIYVETTGNTTYRWSGTTYVKITSGEVSSVAGKKGIITLTKDDVGLSNVDNTSDLDKPLSTAAQTALTALENKGKRGILNLYDTSLIYGLNERVQLATGDIVKSTIDGNTNNPNSDMTGWVKVNSASQISDESGLSQQGVNDLQALKNNDMISIFDFDRFLKATKNLDSSSKINSIIQQIESTNTIPYLYFPTHAHNYRLDSTLTFRKPVPMLFGFLPPNYDRDGYKDMNGWFLVNTPVAVDLGASESTHSGGSWTIKNIGFKPLKTDDNYTQDAIHITSARNGPERGYTFSEVSVSKMNRGIYVKNSANFMAATMIVERCNLSQNNYAIYCDQKVEGLRIVGNQIEQCKINAIKLRGAGGIYIADNMLEGQINPVNIDAISVSTGTQVHITRNYFEANYGDYLISYKDTSYGKGSLIIENNQISELGRKPNATYENTEFCRIYNNQYNYAYTIVNKEAYPLYFYDDANALPSSQLYGKQLQYFVQKGFNGDFGSKVYSDEPTKAQKDSTYTQMSTRGFSTDTLLDTPFGTARAPIATDYLVATVNAQAGDVITANILFKAEFSEALKAGASLVVYKDGIVQNILQLHSAYITQDINKKYILGTFTFKMPSAENVILLRFQNATESEAVQLIAGCFKNHGQFDANVGVKVKQVMPDVSRTLSTIHSVTGEDIAAGATKSYTITLAGARVGDFLEFSFTNVLTELEKKIEITANNTIVLTLKNTTAALITTPNFRVFIKSSKG